MHHCRSSTLIENKGFFFCSNIHSPHRLESDLAFQIIITSLAFCLPILSQRYSETGFADGSRFNLQINSSAAEAFITLSGHQPDGIIWACTHRGESHSFFLCLSLSEEGENKRPVQWSVPWLADWMEGPLSWLFMSTPLQKHTYKSHPVLPTPALIGQERWWRGGACNLPAPLSLSLSLALSCIPRDEFTAGVSL